jgi:hypothetical protein
VTLPGLACPRVAVQALQVSVRHTQDRCRWDRSRFAEVGRARRSVGGRSDEWHVDLEKNVRMDNLGSYRACPHSSKKRDLRAIRRSDRCALQRSACTRMSMSVAPYGGDDRQRTSDTTEHSSDNRSGFGPPATQALATRRWPTQSALRRRMRYHTTNRGSRTQVAITALQRDRERCTLAGWHTHDRCRETGSG